MQRRQLSIVASALSDDPRQAPRVARLHDFAGLLYDAFSAALNIPDLSPSGRRDFRHLLSAENRQLVALRCDLGPHGLGPGADVDRAIARLGKVMESAAALRSPLLCVDVGPLPNPPRQEKPKPRVKPEEAGLIIIPSPLQAASEASTLHHVPEKIDPNFPIRVDAALRELGKLADRLSVSIALRSDLSSFAALERALSAANCPWFGVDLDPVAILRDEWDIDEIFSRLGPFIRHVRARDAVRGDDRRTRAVAIGAGSVNWNQLLSHLNDAAYEGFLTIDPIELPDRLGCAIAGRDHLRLLR